MLLLAIKNFSSNIAAVDSMTKATVGIVTAMGVEAIWFTSINIVGFVVIGFAFSFGSKDDSGSITVEQSFADLRLKAWVIFYLHTLHLSINIHLMKIDIWRMGFQLIILYQILANLDNFFLKKVKE